MSHADAVLVGESEVVLRAAESRLQEPFLFAGDWNTGAHRLDETGKTFVCADHFGRLSTLGWTDILGTLLPQVHREFE